jgi:hypothetical protein
MARRGTASRSHRPASTARPVAADRIPGWPP